MERILVGVDGSSAALDALRWSADLASRTEAELVAARVFEATQAELPPDQDALLHDRQRNELDAWCSRLGESVPIRTLLVDGDPPDALLGAAEHEHADLLIVGGRGAGGFLHLHLGSVAHHLTHHTTIPLAIVPRTGAAPVRHLVIGVDGSPGSLAAAELCAELAGRLDVAVTAVSAFEPFAEWVPESDPRSWRRQAEADVRGWAAAIEKAGVALEVDVVREIHPVAALARALEAHPGATAVVGARGLGGFSGLRLGRVPLQLVHHTGATVIVVPPPSGP
ncbi:MAG TPA: universal stress protein [Acidimicrobiales bacterium]|nr:universal stress protein [Acidimicrobiales bacterium]